MAGASGWGAQAEEIQNEVCGMMVMRLGAALTASGIIGFLLLEALKILMVPITEGERGILTLDAQALSCFIGSPRDMRVSLPPRSPSALCLIC